MYSVHETVFKIIVLVSSLFVAVTKFGLHPTSIYLLPKKQQQQSTVTTTMATFSMGKLYKKLRQQ